jgi:glycosyltransferase involved in cell wall biosynthesis
MRVAHFIQRFPPALGGSEAYFARLSDFLFHQGHDVQVWTTTAIDLETFWSSRGRQLKPGIEMRDGITIRRYAPAHWFARQHFLRALSYFPISSVQRMALPCNPIALRMWFDAGSFDEPIDLVHASAFPYGWLLSCAHKLARRKRAPYFLTPFLHLGDPDNHRDRTRRAYTSKGLRSLLLAADRVFAQTPSERDMISQLGVGDEKIVLQGMGVDFADCTGGDRATARASWHIRDDEVVIGHLANQSKEKGTVDLLRAALVAWEMGARFRVVLAGPRMPNFRRFWDTFPTKDRVVQLGPLSHAQKLDFFAGIDVFCLPSRSDSFGLVLLEAWANGKPVIAYRAGGPADLVHHGEDGLLVPCGDLEGLAEAFILMERQTDGREELGKIGNHRAITEFQWQDRLSIIQREMASITGSRHSCLSGGSR